MSKRYDIVVFGASGFTGKYVVQHLAKACQSSNQSFSWAISGRSEVKLKRVLLEAGEVVDQDLCQSVDIIISDTYDQDSLNVMARSAVVVINCVGPYRFFGNQVVFACVKEGANYVDISGEPQFLEQMQLKYDVEASKQSVFIVGACGFDSIPSDVGQMYLASKMEGDVNDIEVYLRVDTPKGVSGPCINFGTWKSAIHGAANSHELKPLRRKLFPEQFPMATHKLMPRAILHKSSIVGQYCLPFPGADRSVMLRTQRKRYHTDGEWPSQILTYVQFKSLFNAVMTFFFVCLFSLMSKFSFGRYLLETYPSIFSFGLVNNMGGPSKEMIENTNFHMTLIGRGWSVKQSHDSMAPMDRHVTVKVFGRNIGYGATCDCVVQAAIVILQERDKLPGGVKGGGVYTPGYAFKNTTLVDRLCENGVLFSSTVVDKLL